MSKETSTSRFVARNVSKNTHPESNENEFEASLNPTHFPPPRTPLNTIQDPSQSQSQKDFQDTDIDSHHKLEAVRSTRALDKKLEASDRVGNASHSYVTPRVSARVGTKSQSEPNSTQSTPAKSVSRPSIGGANGACNLSSRAWNLYNGGRGGSSSRVSRRVSISSTSVSNCEFPVEVQHFELVQDPSFWTDHNVQVCELNSELNSMCSRGWCGCDCDCDCDVWFVGFRC